MLVHHSDAKAVGIIWVFEMHHFAVFLNDALFRLVHAEQNAHQRGFSRTVFAQKRMDLALFELQRYIVVRNDARELLGDAAHLDDVIHVVLLSPCHIRQCRTHTALFAFIISEFVDEHKENV